MQGPRTGAGRFYRPELDIVRFLAFLLVFLHHILPDNKDVRVSDLLHGFAPVLYATSRAWDSGSACSLPSVPS